MQNRLTLLAIIATLACTACGSNGGAPAAAGLQASPDLGNDVASRNMSGQYVGTVKDSLHGKGKARADFAQFRAALGGTLTATNGTASNTASVAWIVDGTTLRGRSAFAAPSQTCTLAEDATYDPSTHRLNGSYHAVHGCSGEHGSFSLRQQCFYAGDVRFDAGGLKQC